MYVDGIGFWAPGIPDWAALTRALESGEILRHPTRRAAVTRRVAADRAPARAGTVLLACEVAGQACAMAGRDPSTLACVFTSTHGDLAITDAMCATLAADPRELSPTRFPQFRAQRAGGLLDGCCALPCGRDRDQRGAGRASPRDCSKPRSKFTPTANAVLLERLRHRRSRSAGRGRAERAAVCDRVRAESRAQRPPRSRCVIDCAPCSAPSTTIATPPSLAPLARQPDGRAGDAAACRARRR